jgi:hypothetical protein
MSLKKTFFLSLLLALAGGYIYYVELPAGEKKEKQDQLFSAVTESRIAELAVQRGQDSFVLKNLKPETEVVSDRADPEGAESTDGAPSKAKSSTGKGSQWQLGDIQGAQLDDGALTSLTSAVLGLKVGEALPTEDVDKDLSVYGLTSPELELKVRSVSKEGSPLNLDLRFGKKNEYVKLRYMQVKDLSEASDAAPRVCLVPEALFLSANRAATDFRKKTFVSFLDSELKKVSFDSNFGKLSLDAQPEAKEKPALRESKWLLQVGGASDGAVLRKASQTLVAEILRELRNTKASAFIDGDEAKAPEKYGFTESAPKLTIEFNEQGKATLELRFAPVKEKDSFGRGPGTYVSMSGVPSLFFVDGDLPSKLFKSGSDLRDRQLFQFDSEKVQKIEITRPGGESFSMLKAGETWNVATAAGVSEPSDPSFASQYVNDLSLIRADGFPEESRDFGFEAPVGKVVVSLGSEGASKATLVLGSEVVNGAHYAGVLVGDASVVAEPFILSAEGISKIFPRREVLVPAPTPVPEGVEASGASGASATTESGAEIVDQEVSE